MVKFLLLLIFLAPNSTYAGADFSMLSGKGYTRLPEFKTAEDARKFGHMVKWDEPIRRMMRGKMEAIREELIREERGLTDITNFSDAVNYNKLVKLATQYEAYVMAIMIIEDYKKLGIKGSLGDIDKAMRSTVGASMYAESRIVK